VPPSTPPSGIFFCTSGEYVSMSNEVFNFNFLALLTLKCGLEDSRSLKLVP